MAKNDKKQVEQAEKVEQAAREEGLEAGKVQDTEVIFQTEERKSLGQQAAESSGQKVAVRVNPALRAYEVRMGEVFEEGKLYFVDPSLLERKDASGIPYLVEVNAD